MFQDVLICRHRDADVIERRRAASPDVEPSTPVFAAGLVDEDEPREGPGERLCMHFVNTVSRYFWASRR